MAEEQISVEQYEENKALLATEEEEDDLSKPLTPEEIHRRLTRPFHPATHKQSQGFTYIPQAVIRKRINIATRNQYNWEITREEYRDPHEVSGTGMAIHKVTGRLTIPGLGFREGTGTAQIRKGTEEQYKSAESDAFKRAAMGFGVALELYPGEKEADVEAGEAPRLTPETKRKGAASRSPAPAGEPLSLRDIKAAIARAAEHLGAEVVAGHMQKSFKRADGKAVEVSSELTEEQWRAFHAWAQNQLAKTS